MISLKKLLPDKESEASLLPVVKRLLEGIALHTVPGDPEDHTRFRESIGRVKEKLEKEISTSELSALSDSVLRALEVYNQRTTKYLGMRSAELQSIGQLQEIEKQLDAATQIDEVRQVASRLSECLKGIRLGTPATQEATVASESAKARIPLIDTDSVTGLNSRKPAAEALAAACQGDEQAYVLIFMVNRLQVLNTRFSFEVGDEILRYFAGFLKRELTSTDLIFRWTGPTLLAILYRSDSFAKVRDEIGPRMDVKYEHTVQSANRTIVLPISTRWAMFPMMASPRMLIQKIDGFGSFESSRD